MKNNEIYYNHKKLLGWFYFLTGNISFPKSVFLAENGFNSEFNAVSIIDNNKIEKIEKNLKSYIANKIAKKIINNFTQ